MPLLRRLRNLHPLCRLEALCARWRPPAPPTPEALARHAAAEAAGAPTYTDPVSGREVMTEAHLRATLEACCGMGCRHCPWPDAR